MKKATMKDIANKLNISINAVSIALNDKEGVSHNLRISILEEAVRMNYPLKKLNSKVTLKNKTLIVMIEDKKKKDTYYYLKLLKNIEKEAAVFGYRILTEFYNIKDFYVPKNISEHHVAGVIILGKINENMIHLLKLYINEIVCINHSIPYMNINYIESNDFLGGYLSCEYFINKGYTSIGFIGEIEKSKNFKLRYQGYRQCMVNHFHPKKSEFICLTKGIEKAVLNNDYKYIQMMLLTYRKMPQAFICVNDRNAAITIKALQYNGYKIPEDIEIIGYDNMELCTQISPSLSSLEISTQTLAKKAIRKIHEIIHEDTIPETIMLSPRIIERNSTQTK